MSITVSSQAWSSRRPARSAGSVMFSSAVSVGMRLNDWNTKPMRSRRRIVSSFSDIPDEPLAAHLDRRPT